MDRIAAVFEGWRERPGPRYQRLAAAVLDAVEAGTLRAGAQLPAERALAEGLGISRGTVVAAMEQLERAGVVRRRQGAGTFVASRPGWARGPSADPAAALLRRRLAARSSIDLSLSVPPGVEHLPPVDWSDAVLAASGHGLDPVGSLELRERIAAHLGEHQQLPTTAEQLVVTAGAQQALSLLAAVIAPRATVVTGCPTYPGLRSAFARRRVSLVPVPGDGTAGADVDAMVRAAKKAEHAVVFVAPTGANPTGSVMPRRRREVVLAGARSARALVVEDMVLADLPSGDEVPPPLAAMDPSVVVVGSVSKLLWAGLRIGWVRAEEPLRSALVRAKAATELATSRPAELITERLLAAVDPQWLRDLRGALAFRRDHFVAALAPALPSWTLAESPAAGLSLWLRLPLDDAETFGHVAAGRGVVVAPGTVACVCGRHRGHVRLSFAQPPEELDLATDRLTSAWAAHCEELAATPSVR